MIFRRILFTIILLSLSSLLFSQYVKNIGTPLYENYLPEEINSHPQTWQITQDSLGLLYFANQQGIYLFDGSNWTNFFAIQGVRSVNYKKGKIYYGAENEFGYVYRDSIGKHQIKRLSDVSNDTTASCFILSIVNKNNFTYFIGINKIYVFKNDTIINIIKSINGFRYGFFIDNNIYVRDIDNGIITVSEKGILKIKNTDIFKQEALSFITKFSKDTLLIGTLKNGLYFFIKNKNEYKLSKIKTNFDKFLQLNEIGRGINIDKDKIAIGTMYNGLIIINKKFEILDFYNSYQILPNNAINYIFKDKENNLWIATNNGISWIDYNSGVYNLNINKFDNKELIISSLYFKNNLYFATFGGFYKIVPIDINKNTNVKIPYKIQNMLSFKDNFMSVLNLKNSLILTGRKGVYEFNGITINTILNSQLNMSAFCYNFDSNYVFIGSFNGIHILKKENNNWINKGLIRGFNQEIRYIKAINNNELFLGSQNVPPVKLIFNNIADLAKNKFTQKKYNHIKDINYNDISGLNCIDDKLFFTSNDNIFVYDRQKDNFIKDTSFIYYDKKTEEKTCMISSLLYKNKYCLNDSILYGTNANSISKLKRDTNNNYCITTKPFRIVPKTGYFNISSYKNKIYFSGPSGLLYYNKQVKYKNKKFLTVFNYIIVNDDTISFGKNNAKINLKYKNRNIKFLFTALFFEKSASIKYKYILKGYDKKWSGWLTDKYAIYTNLPNGTYTFKVKAINIYGQESAINTYTFTIMPPWYLKWWVLVLMLILLIILIRLFFILYTKRLKIQNQKLEETIAKRTSELKIKNLELEKLSIVARETDNAVLIMNPNGDFVWINESLTKKYGFTLDEHVKTKAPNILKSSSNKNIHEIFKKCIDTKESIYYENYTTTKNGEKIWTQTTLTPILDNKNNIIYVVAIDSDISQLKSAEQKIKKQNELINYSINYAKKIQDSILPKKEDLDKFFDENFILYKPRDVISGDFYWFYKKNNKKYIVTADSTGHSVPGAFMSIIGQMLLNDVIILEKTNSLENILYKLNDKIIKTLNQEHHNIDSQSDGMDLSIVCYDENTKELELATANQMIYVFNNSEKIFFEGSVFSIGGIFSNSDNVKYVSKKIKLTKDVNVYMFSDGFQDQFGGEHNKKFLIKRFRQMILNNYNKDFNEQYAIYDIEFNNWKGDKKQIDDVMLIGFKIKV